MKMRVLSIQSITVLMLSFVFAVAISGQDLGSSNKLFGGGTTTTAKTKKAPAKTQSPKPKTAPKAKPAPHKAVIIKKKPAKSATAVIAPKKNEQATVVIAPKVNPKNSKEPKVIINDGTPPVVTGGNSAANDAEYEGLIDSGNSARDERDYGGAETAYRKASKLKPRDSRAYLGLGNLYSDQQRWEDAEKAYRSSVALEPEYVDLLVALSFILTRPVSAPNLYERYSEAQTLARKAIKLDANSALAADQLGVALELSGELGSETENAYRRSIQLDSDFAPAYAHLGRLLLKKGDKSGSAAAYARAMSHAVNIGTKLLVADVLQAEGKFADSVPLLNRVLAEDPRNPTALTMLGRALTTQGNFAEAERYLKTSVDVSPSSFVSYSLLATLFVRQSKFETAENYLLQATRFVNSFDKRLLATQFETVGDGYVKSNKTNAAGRSYRQGLSLDPERETLATKAARFK